MATSTSWMRWMRHCCSISPAMLITHSYRQTGKAGDGVVRRVAAGAGGRAAALRRPAAPACRGCPWPGGCHQGTMPRTSQGRCGAGRWPHTCRWPCPTAAARPGLCGGAGRGGRAHAVVGDPRARAVEPKRQSPGSSWLPPPPQPPTARPRCWRAHSRWQSARCRGPSTGTRRARCAPRSTCRRVTVRPPPLPGPARSTSHRMAVWSLPHEASMQPSWEKARCHTSSV